MKIFLFQLGYYWNFNSTPKRGIKDNLLVLSWKWRNLWFSINAYWLQIYISNFCKEWLFQFRTHVLVRINYWLNYNVWLVVNLCVTSARNDEMLKVLWSQWEMIRKKGFLSRASILLFRRKLETHFFFALIYDRPTREFTITQVSPSDILRTGITRLPFENPTIFYLSRQKYSSCQAPLNL